MDNSLPGNQHFLKKLLGELTDWEKSNIYLWAKDRRINKLIGELRHRDPGVRMNAAVFLGDEALAGKDISAAFPALMNALGDECADVRVNASVALVHIVNCGHDISAAAPILIGMLSEEDGGVRGAAAFALSRAPPKDYSDLEMIASLAKTLKKEGKGANHLAVVYSAWAKELNGRAGKLVDEKGFHIPRVQKTDRIDKVLKLRRSCL